MFVLGGSWVVITGIISPLIWVISVVTLLITLLVASLEPPSQVSSREAVEASLGSLHEAAAQCKSGPRVRRVFL